MASNMIVRVPNGNILDAVRPSLDTASPSMYSRPHLITNEGIPWRQVMRILRKHWKVSLAFVLALEIGLALLVFSLDDTYEGQATIEVESPGAGEVTLVNGAPAATAQQDYLETQTEILKGDSLALGVIDELHLADSPVFLKQSWIEKLPSQAMTWITRTRTESRSQTEQLLEIYRNQLSVTQLRNSRLVQVGYESYDPRLAAGIVNTAVRQYLETTHRSKYDATLRAAQSLAPELNELKNSVDQSGRALLDFQRTHEGVELGASSDTGSNGIGGAVARNPVGIRVAELNQQLTQAMGERLQQESYMQLLGQGKNDVLPQMKDDPVMQGLTTRIGDIRAQLAQALAVYGGNNPEVRKLESQAEELTSQLEAQRDRIADQLRATYASALRREELIQKTLRDLKSPLNTSNANVAQYEALKRDADANSSLYVSLSSRIKELAVTGSLNANNIRVVDEARIPERPSGPHRVRILLFGFMFGLAGGVALAFVSEGMDDTISSLDDLRNWSKLPTLALVPRFSGTTGNHLLSRKKVPSLSLQSLLGIKAKGIPVFVERPHSPEAESIRNLGTAIRLSGLSGERRVQTVLITSAFPGEGKTTLAVNLAVALARYGKTCLVDADFRHPAITSAFGLSLRPGLQDLLVKTRTPHEVCTPLPEAPALAVVGTGMRNPDALEMLTSQRMRDLTEELRKTFQYIVLDSPPIVPFSDARWLSTLSDGAVLVARSSATTRRALIWGIELLEEVQAPLLGIVLNGVDLQSEYYSYGVDNYSRN